MNLSRYYIFILFDRNCNNYTKKIYPTFIFKKMPQKFTYMPFFQYGNRSGKEPRK